METSLARVLFLSAEVAPLAKAGGLADVAGSLPKALRALGVEVRILMPKYRQIDEKRYPLTQLPQEFRVHFDGIDHVVRLFQTTLPGSDVPVYLLDHPHYEGAGDIYYQDVTNSTEQRQLQIERFLFFSIAAHEFLRNEVWNPNIVHCHDWHTAAFPYLCSVAPYARPSAPKTLYTIHNLPLQGSVDRKRFSELFAPLDVEALPAAARQNESINLTALGLSTADALTTVSPSYAKEILTPEYGGGLHDLLRTHKKKLRGILNGIDVAVYDPEHDPAVVPYGLSTLKKKRDNRVRLLKELNLRDDGPIFGLVTRLTSQKGISLVCDIGPRLVELGVRLVVLGSGEPELERRLQQLSAAHPDAVSVTIGFDAALAQRIYAGSDAFLMPSLFEPCGLGQLIALRYGTLPIARATGGLQDTIRDGEHGTGFLFNDATAPAFLAACERALAVFAKPRRWERMQQHAMREDFSWTASAHDYHQLYLKLLDHGTAQ